MADVSMPQLGETVTEGTITRWFKQVGDAVALDEVLFEVSTDKVDSEVPSPVAGVLTEIRVPEGDTVDVGAVLAVIDEADAASEATSSAEPTGSPGPTGETPAAAPGAAAPPPRPAPGPAPGTPSVPAPGGAAVDAGRAGADPAVAGRVLSPIVRRLLTEHDLDPAAVAGTGVGGRITRADVERAVRGSRPTTPTPPPPPASIAVVRSGERDTAVPLSNIRRRTGEHMVESKRVSPHAMTAVEVDFEGVDRVRRAEGTRFREEEGFSLTFLPFIARAVIDALEEFPHLNASVGETELVVHNYVNLSIAVDLGFEGLLAPVVRDADQKRLRFIAREVHDLANRARSRQLSADEIVGGTFTLTNAGSYGTHMVIPVINQPQVAILSTDGVSRKPVVLTDAEGAESIGIHSVGILAMSWDHRAFDGAYAAAFLDRVRHVLETRDWAPEL